jgi:hypothetical protein
MNSVDKKLLALESYLKENGHGSESIGVSRIRKESFEKASSVSGGKCSDAVMKAEIGKRCFECDELEEADNYRHIMVKAEKDDYPVITEYTVDHVGKSRTATGRTLVGHHAMVSKTGVMKWKEDACKRLSGVTYEPGDMITVGLPEIGRVEVPIIAVDNPSPGECSGKDCDKTQIKLTIKIPDVGAIKPNPLAEYQGKTFTIFRTKPLRFEYKIVGFLDDDCAFNESLYENLTDEQFIRTCFKYSSGIPDEQHNRQPFVSDDAAYVYGEWADKIIEIEDSARGNPGSSCRFGKGSDCPDIGSHEFKIDIKSPQDGATYKSGSGGLNASVNITTEDGESIPKEYVATLYYHDLGNPFDAERTQASSGMFCGNLGRVSDKVYSARMSFDRLNTGNVPGKKLGVDYWIAISCGNDIIFRSNSGKITVETAK